MRDDYSDLFAKWGEPIRGLPNWAARWKLAAKENRRMRHFESDEADEYCEAFLAEREKRRDWPTFYPQIVFMDRYGGTYSGGNYIALNEDHIPEGAMASDEECLRFWLHYEKPYGVGENPQDALINLDRKLKGYD